MRRLSMLAVAGWTAGIAWGAELNPALAGRMEAAIDRGMMRAAVVGTYDRGEMEVRGFGRISGVDGALPGADTVFEIGSISKVFTALLAVRQAEAGRLSLDDRLAERLPDVQFANAKVAAITLRELATHHSGLPRLPDNLASEDPQDPYADYRRGELMAFLGAFDPSALDKAYVYSNLGAGLLGELAAAAAGRDYAGAMRRDLLEPLGMKDTGIGLSNDQAVRLAAGFNHGLDAANWNFVALAGAGALRSTARDLLHFIDLNLNPGQTEIGSALQAALAEQEIADNKLGLGWHIRALDEDGDRIYWHSGGTGGYASMLALRPSTATGVVILTTSTSYSEVTEWGIQQLAGVPGPPAAPMEDYLGSYELKPGFVMTVSREADQLYGQATGQGRFALTPDGEDAFAFPAADIRIVFARGADGEVESLVLHQAGREMLGRRVADAQGIRQYEAIELAAGVLEQYVGRYRLAPGVEFDIELEDGQLRARLGAQPYFPVFPYAPDRFFYRVVDAQLSFERDAAGKVIALILHQNGDQRAPRIDPR